MIRRKSEGVYEEKDKKGKTRKHGELAEMRRCMLRRYEEKKK